MDDFIINSIVDFTKYHKGYYFEVYCTVTEEMNIPDNVKEQFGMGNPIMFIMADAGHTKPEFDFENGILHWNASFGGRSWRLGIPADNINIIVDVNADKAIQFVRKDKTQKSKETKKTESIPPEIKLVVDNGENYKKTPPKGKLELVK